MLAGQLAGKLAGRLVWVCQAEMEWDRVGVAEVEWVWGRETVEKWAGAVVAAEGWVGVVVVVVGEAAVAVAAAAELRLHSHIHNCFVGRAADHIHSCFLLDGAHSSPCHAGGEDTGGDKMRPYGTIKLHFPAIKAASRKPSKCTRIRATYSRAPSKSRAALNYT